MVIGAFDGSALPAVPPVYFSAQSLLTAGAAEDAAVAVPLPAPADVVVSSRQAADAMASTPNSARTRRRRMFTGLPPGVGVTDCCERVDHPAMPPAGAVGNPLCNSPRDREGGGGDVRRVVRDEVA